MIYTIKSQKDIKTTFKKVHKKTEYRSITKHFMTHFLLFSTGFFKVGLPPKKTRCPRVRTLHYFLCGAAAREPLYSVTLSHCIYLYQSISVCPLNFCHRKLPTVGLTLLAPFPPLDNIQVTVIVWRLRGNVIRTALCWIVWHNVHSLQHTYVSSSYRSNRLGLSHWDPNAVCRGSCLDLYYCNMVQWFWWDSSLISTTNWFPSVLWHCSFGHLAC